MAFRIERVVVSHDDDLEEKNGTFFLYNFLKCDCKNRTMKGFEKEAEKRGARKVVEYCDEKSIGCKMNNERGERKYLFEAIRN